MKWTDRLGASLGRWAIPHLMRYIVALNALVYLLQLVNPGYITLLDLDREAILSGQVWRLATWIFLPNTTSALWIFFYLMFTWWVGETLEMIWGTARLNAYYLLGVMGCTVAALLFGISGGNFLLILSLLLAIATLAPDERVLLLVFPVKLKWVAILSIAYPWGLLFVTGSWGIRAMIVVCLANYLLFFGGRLLALAQGIRPSPRNPNKQSRTHQRTPATLTATRNPHEPGSLHRCHACGITEITHPEADFRVATDGLEYCRSHLPR